MAHRVTPADERRHAPGQERTWEEWWSFEAAARDASFGILVRLGMWPNAGVAWFWAYLVGDGRPLLAVRSHDVPLPRGRVLEVRGDGLWSAMHCETPLEHWSLGLEAFAVALDDAGVAYRGERGDLVPVGLDLEWEVGTPLLAPEGGTRYHQAGVVHGEVLVGDEVIELEAPGHRAHGWGPGAGWASSWCRAAGRLGDGTAFAAAGSGAALAPARPSSPGDALAARFSATAGRDADGFPHHAELLLGERRVRADPRHHVGVPLDGPAGDGRVAASLCRLTDGAGPDGGGSAGAGWVAWHDPAPRG